MYAAPQHKRGEENAEHARRYAIRGIERLTPR